MSGERPGPAIMVAILAGLALAALAIGAGLILASVTVAGLVNATPACVTEDAPGPCHWDGGDNGEGRHYIVVNGAVLYAPGT